MIDLAAGRLKFVLDHYSRFQKILDTLSLATLEDNEPLQHLAVMRRREETALDYLCMLGRRLGMKDFDEKKRETLNPYRKSIYDSKGGFKIGEEELTFSPEEQAHRETLFKEVTSFLGKQVLVATPYKPLIDLVYGAINIDRSSPCNTMRATHMAASYVVGAHIQNAGTNVDDAQKNFTYAIAQLSRYLGILLNRPEPPTIKNLHAWDCDP